MNKKPNALIQIQCEEWNPGIIKLTVRESQVARMIANGLSDKEIARELDISFWTVRSHVGRLFKKFGARCRVDIARRQLETTDSQ